MEELEKIKKAESFLGELMMQRESSEKNLILKDEKMKKDISEAFCVAYATSLKLKDIGFEKIKEINSFMNASVKESIRMYPESAIYQDLLMRRSSGIFSEIPKFSGDKRMKYQVIEYDSISIGIKALQTYETLAPWLEEVNKCKIVKGLTKILENEKC